jgi:hypothetical protein
MLNMSLLIHDVLKRSPTKNRLVVNKSILLNSNVINIHALKPIFFIGKKMLMLQELVVHL